MTPAPPRALILIHGVDRYRVDAAAWRWRLAVGEMGAAVEIIDAPARVSQVRNSLLEVPLFGGPRHLVIRDPPQLAERPRRGADSAEALADLLGERPPDARLCLVAHAGVPATHPVAAAVVALGGEISAHPALRGRELRAWVEEAARDRGLRLSRPVIDHLIAVAGSDLGIVTGELDKLRALAEVGPMTPAAALSLIAGDEIVQTWSVIDGLLGDCPGRGAAALHALIDQGRPPQYLLGVLAGQVREILIAQASLRRGSGGAGSLAADLRVPAWRAERLARQARSVPPVVPSRLLRSLQRLDARVKAGEIGDADGLRTFGLQAAALVTAARRGGR